MEVLAKSDGPARRVAADGGVDNGFRIGIARAADSEAIDSFDQIDDAVRKIDELDGPANRRAKLLVYDTDGAGVKLVDELDDSTLRTVLDMDIDRARELRSAFARQYDQGNADLTQIENFAKHTDNLEGIDGLNNGPVDDFMQAGGSGNVRGALDEVRRADDIGAENIERMSLEVYDGKERVGELDIQVESGKIVESKGSFGYTEEGISNELRKKLRTMRVHEDVHIDGNTLEIRANQVGDKNLIRTQINQWEETVATNAKWNQANVDIRIVVEDGSRTVIGG
ncbi:hypothetical protein HSR122_0103 [Halapricum desulfuricans]|uniref:Uncharacterized protein n=1 Tax=Halapricum desulfuricans TaxID=2841257 RepID=A0A897N8I6_9EURY|nr:hypothetical protein HSR122_0103 [Halapricum desulfuricans]